jgi:hypothetical protein
MIVRRDCNRLTRSLRWLPVFAAILMSASGTMGQPAGSPGPDEEGVKKFRVNVVRIDVRFGSSQRQETGFGFVVGASEGQLIVVTANHVVRSNDPDAGESKVSVTFFGGTSRQAALLSQRLGVPHDLAVLEVPSPSNFRWIAESIAPRTEIVRNQEVWFIGRGGDWYIPSRGSARINDVPDLQSIIQVDTTAVLRGTSGAPLLTNNGIIGMIVSDDQGVLARALAIDYIRQALDRWGYKWSAHSSGESVPLLAAGQRAPQWDEPACLNGIWHENRGDLTWRFVLEAGTLKIRRTDDFVKGELSRSAGSWVGALDWGNGERWNGVRLEQVACNEVRTNRGWWYRR